MLRVILLALTLGLAGPATVGVASSPVSLAKKAQSSVVGQGKTYQEAYQSAKRQLPPGVSHHKVDSHLGADKVYVVRLWYYVRD